MVETPRWKQPLALATACYTGEEYFHLGCCLQSVDKHWPLNG